MSVTGYGMFISQGRATSPQKTKKIREQAILEVSSNLDIRREDGDVFKSLQEFSSVEKIDKA